MRMRGVGFIVSVIGLTALTGCAAAPLGSPTVATPGMPNLQAALNRAIRRTDAAVDQLNGVPVVRLASAHLSGVVPAELQQPIQWTYRGYLIHAVRALAKISGYHAIVQRARHGRPIPVSVSVHHVPVITVIRELGIQAGARADVEVDPRTHTISVIETGAAAPSPSPPPVAGLQPEGATIRAQPLRVVPEPALSVPSSDRPQSLITN
ncbi:MAG: DotD/TraH family lipoprotein [Acidiphilium sp.]|nr:DotD/TraH family lipoprotein [Acidiphilium sp.]MDD4937067.1 DotD/TraH family lipoprotein [Acidiphilium sp.]